MDSELDLTTELCKRFEAGKLTVCWLRDRLPRGLLSVYGTGYDRFERREELRTLYDLQWKLYSVLFDHDNGTPGAHTSMHLCMTCPQPVHREVATAVYKLLKGLNENTNSDQEKV